MVAFLTMKERLFTAGAASVRQEREPTHRWWKRKRRRRKKRMNNP
jgi:hypothetical protein